MLDPPTLCFPKPCLLPFGRAVHQRGLCKSMVTKPATPITSSRHIKAITAQPFMLSFVR